MNRFIGHENWKRRFPSQTEMEKLNITYEDKNVTVHRSILFFYATQKTKLSNIREIFTELAIKKLIHDKFIEIHD